MLFASCASIAALPLTCSVTTASVYDGVPLLIAVELDDPTVKAVVFVVEDVTDMVVTGVEPDPPGRHCEYQALE